MSTCGQIRRVSVCRALDLAGAAVTCNNPIGAYAGTNPSYDAATLQAIDALMLHDHDGSMLTYPPLVHFPEVEDAGWSAIHDALTGEIDAATAVARMQAAAEEVLA